MAAMSFIFFSCLPFTKENYISNYKQFISNVKENKDSFTDSEWQEHDKLFWKYSSEYYKNFETKITAEEKILLIKYRLEYDIYRYGNEAASVLLCFFNSYFIETNTNTGTDASNTFIKQKNELKRQIENYIEYEIDDDTDFIIEQGKKVRDAFNRVLDEFITLTEEN
jgi:hypothetical protein